MGIGGGGAAGLVVVCGAAVGGAAAVELPAAVTALWQPGDRVARLRCRHCREAEPPGGTLAQCDW